MKIYFRLCLLNFWYKIKNKLNSNHCRGYNVLCNIFVWICSIFMCLQMENITFLLFFHALSQAVILYFPFQTLKALNKYILVNQCNQLDQTNLYNLKIWHRFLTNMIKYSTTPRTPVIYFLPKIHQPGRLYLSYWTYIYPAF